MSITINFNFSYTDVWYIRGAIHMAQSVFSETIENPSSTELDIQMAERKLSELRDIWNRIEETIQASKYHSMNDWVRAHLFAAEKSDSN